MSSAATPSNSGAASAAAPRKRFPIVKALDIPPLPRLPRRNILLRAIEKYHIESVLYMLEPWERATIDAVVMVSVWFNLMFAIYAVQWFAVRWL